VRLDTVRSGGARVASTRDGDEEAEMNSSDIAREQISDRVRQADAFRRSRQTRVGQRQDRQMAARRVYQGFVAALAAPFRH
jgi:hypothetical protein